MHFDILSPVSVTYGLWSAIGYVMLIDMEFMWRAEGWT